jgi:hypothetical protein
VSWRIGELVIELTNSRIHQITTKSPILIGLSLAVHSLAEVHSEEAEMMRRLICCVAIVASSGVAMLIAQERATFILTTGERKAGTLVFHGGNRENMIAGNLNLGIGNNQEESYRGDQVAVISFVGGRPSNAELEGLPNDRSHRLVMRNGAVESGEFVNIIGGDTVKWRFSNGDTRDIPVRDVERIYLNPGSARQTFNVTNQTQINPVATAGTVLESGATRVDANQQWTNTGINVRAGDLVSFRATGRIAFGQGATQTAGPDGNDSLRNTNYPVGVMPVGGLIGRVGNGAPFPIGSNSQPIRMPANGTLMLGVNDDAVGDNSGFFSVVISRN